MKFYASDGLSLEELKSLEGFGYQEGRFLLFVDGAGEQHLVLGSRLPQSPEHKALKKAALTAHPDWRQVAAGYGDTADYWYYSTISTVPEKPDDPGEAEALLAHIREAAVAIGFGK